MASDLPNLPAGSLFNTLVPSGVAALDVRGLMQAVVNGFQYRLEDLRALAGQYPELINPTPEPLTCVLVQYTADPGGNIVPATLNATGDTPTDPDALADWAAVQLEIPVESIVSAVYGTDALRLPGVDPAHYLAQSLGAALYPGLPGETVESVAQRRRLALAYYFPRLRIKGTAQSFSIFARLAGFDDGVMIPLWTRLSPRVPQDVGAAPNDADFSQVANILPSGQLPDPSGLYVPQDFTDGPFYSWSSGSLVTDPDSPQFYTTAVNGNNPFFNLQASGEISHPVAGTYTFVGGAPGRRSATMLDSGTHISHLAAVALAEDDSFNGMRLVVSGEGDGHRRMEVTARLSSVKYRSSWFDAALFKADSGTRAVESNTDLAADPTMVSDGTATAPFRPWAGGEWQPIYVTLWPQRQVGPLGFPTARTQASGTSTQADYAGLVADAQRIYDLSDEVQAATRQPRRRAVGFRFADQMEFAAYPCRTPLATLASSGSFGGTIFSSFVPGGDYDASFTLTSGGTVTDLATQFVGANAFTFAGPGISGVFSRSGTWWQAQVTTGTGNLEALWSDPDSSTVRTEPSAVLYQQGRVCFTQTPEGTLPLDESNLTLWDDVPWMRPLLAGGEPVGADYFVPAFGDPSPAAQQNFEGVVKTVSGAYQKATVFDLPDVSDPPFIQLLDLPGDARPLTVACAGSGTNLYPVVGVSPNAIVAEATWKPGRYEDLALWWPLTEQPYQALAPVPAFGPSSLTADFDYTARQYDSQRGWTLVLNSGGTVATDLELGQEHAFAFTARALSNAGAGKLSEVSVAGSTVQFSSGTVGIKRGHLSASLPFGANGTATLVTVNVSGTATDLALGTALGWGASVSVSGTIDGSRTVALVGGDTGVALQDFSIWTTRRTTAQFDAVRNPTYVPLDTPVERPYIGAVSSDRWALEILASGFVVPSGTLAQNEDSLAGAVVRYDGTGRYSGNPAFKQTGLGGAQSLPATLYLGTTGVAVPATGQVVTAGTFGEPGDNIAWETGSGKLYSVSAPYSGTGGTTGTSVVADDPWPPSLALYNAATDRVYLPGDDGQLWQVCLDDVGSGVVFTAALPLVSDIPLVSTDFPTRLGTVVTAGITSNSVNELGQYILAPGQIAPLAGTNTPSAYVYLLSRAKCWVSSAFARWVNRNAYGESLGVAALQEQGALDFENSEPLPSGYYRLSVDCGNIGTVDNQFRGFDVEVTLDPGTGDVVSFPAVLLPDGAGANPRGWTFVEFTVPVAVTGPWRLTLRWTNDRDVPSRGEYRRLAVYAYTLRRIASELQQVVPLPVEILPVNVAAPPLAAGAYIASYNSFGTIASYTHEQDAYAYTAGTDSFNNPVSPLADQLTGSTLNRRDSLLAPAYTPPDAAAPAAPVAGTIAVSPVKAYYNVGDAVRLTNSGASGFSSLRRCWHLWSSGTQTTYGSVIDAIVDIGGTLAINVDVVDDLGQSTTAAASIVSNWPPQILLASATVLVGPVPYATDLSAIVSDPEGDGFNVTWWKMGTNPALIGSGTYVTGYIVEENQTVRAYAIDSRSGTNTADLPLAALSTSAPAVTIVAVEPKKLRSTTSPQKLQVIATASDPSNLPFTTLWEFWDGVQLPGLRQPMPYFSGGTYCTVERSVEGENGLPLALGTKAITLTAVNTAGGTSVAAGRVEVIEGTTPVIISVSASAPGVRDGAIVQFSGDAYDPSGAALNYRWDFPIVGLTLFGANVEFNTTGLTGKTIGGTLTVDNGFGGQASAPAPNVAVSASGLSPITLDPAGGVQTQGVLVEATSPDSGVTIRYTLNGPVPAAENDGTEYTGKIMVPYVAGTSVTVSARAFKATYAPSPAASATFTFPATQTTAPTTPATPAAPTVNNDLLTLRLNQEGAAFDTTRGSGSYAKGTVVFIHADLDVGEYRFLYWFGSAEDRALVAEIGNNDTQVVLNKSVSLTAVYERWSSVLGTIVPGGISVFNFDFNSGPIPGTGSVIDTTISPTNRVNPPS